MPLYPLAIRVVVLLNSTALSRIEVKLRRLITGR